MAASNYRVEQPVSWFTGRPVPVDGPCATRKCPQPATTWIACDYRTGKWGRIATRHKAYCSACAQKVLAKHAAPAA